MALKPNVVAVAFALAAVACARFVCACTPAAGCASAHDCAAGSACLAHECHVVDDSPPVVPGPGPGAITIDAIDGTGSARAPSTVAAGQIAAAHRLHDTLVVHGHNLNDVVSATLGGVSLGITPDGDTMRLTLPAHVTSGLSTLLLVGSAAQTASADVFLLQGEPGKTSLVAPRAPTSCDAGGVGLAFGLDDNDNGVLDDDEIDRSLSRDVCSVGASGDAAFTCNAGTCTTENHIVIDSLGGGSLLVGTQKPVLDVVGFVQVFVPDDFPSIAEALASLDGTQLDGDIRIVVEQDIVEPAPVEPHHRDGRNIVIIGTSPTARPTISFADTGFFVSNASIRIQDVIIAGAGSSGAPGTIVAGALGVVAADAAAVTLSNVEVTGFDAGVLAQRSSSIVGAKVIADHNNVGFSSFLSSSIIAGAGPLKADHNTNVGFLASLGGSIDADNATSTNNGIGFLATRLGSMQALNSQANANANAGVIATEMGYAILAKTGTETCDLSNNTNADVQASFNSMVNASGAIKDTPAADATSIVE